MDVVIALAIIVVGITAYRWLAGNDGVE